VRFREPEWENKSAFILSGIVWPEILETCNDEAKLIEIAKLN
jgi:hypothetical protein